MAEIIKRVWRIAAAALLLLAAVSPASAEVPAQGWLDSYDGKLLAVGRIMATSYALGMADGLIATGIMSCPTDYRPGGDALARTTADVLRNEIQRPGISVTAAVLGALTIDGCIKSPRAQELSR